MIADRELRELFRAESEEHLQRLDECLLQMAARPNDRALLEEAFREAHSLKGGARSVGARPVEDAAHSVEDALRPAARGEASLAPEMLDRLAEALHGIRRLVNEAATDEPAGITAPQIAQRLQGEPATGPPPAAPAAEEGAGPAFPTRIETVRVATTKLDALMTHTGELRVVTGQIGRRIAELEALVELSEDWDRDFLEFSRLSSADASGYAAREKSRLQRLAVLIGALRQRQQESGARLELVSSRIEDGVRAIRMLPLATMFGYFPRLVHDLAKAQGKEVKLVIEGGETTADKHVLEEMKDPLIHLVRNALDHGIEPPDERARIGKSRAGSVWLRARQLEGSVMVEVADDGRGLDLAAIGHAAVARGLRSEDEIAAMGPTELQALIFVSGISTTHRVTEISGRGVGLDVVRANVERLKGDVEVASVAGQGCTVRMRLPLSLVTTRVLIGRVGAHGYAIPTTNVALSRLLTPDDIFHIEGNDMVAVQGRLITVTPLARLLELPSGPARTSSPDGARACVIFADEEHCGVLLDELIDECEVVVKPFGAPLQRVRNVAGATLLETGEVCMVLNPQDLLRSLRKRAARAAPARPAAPATARRRSRVLLVEDQIVTRTLEKRLLEDAGYEVVTAVDGVDALAKLAAAPMDAVVSDILMPNLDGLALTRKLRADKRYAELPVILVTTLSSEEDRQKGLDAGANAYLPKAGFEQATLLEALKRLIGPASNTVTPPGEKQ